MEFYKELVQDVNAHLHEVAYKYKDGGDNVQVYGRIQFDLRALTRSWFHFLVPLKKSETHFRSANQGCICVIDGTFGIT